jgi:hypothetical protein
MGYNWLELKMKKITMLIIAIIGFTFVANAQVTGSDIVNSLRKADTKENKCYTSDGQEGRLRTTSTSTTTTYSNSQGSSRNSGSRSETNGFGSSLGVTNSSASVNSSSTYNSGSSSRSNSNTQTTTTTVNKTCVPKSELPLYNH